MSVFNKKQKFEIGDQCSIYSPQSIMNFINEFGMKFEMEIISIDISSIERKFKIHYLYYKENTQKDAVIEISNYDAELKYFIETKGLDELSFRTDYKNQTEFIKKFL